MAEPLDIEPIAARNRERRELLFKADELSVSDLPRLVRERLREIDAQHPPYADIDVLLAEVRRLSCLS
jgi:hypothetical protein